MRKFSITLVIAARLIPEQIREYRFGALLEINNKFTNKSNVFSYMMSSAGLTLQHDFEK